MNHSSKIKNFKNNNINKKESTNDEKFIEKDIICKRIEKNILNDKEIKTSVRK